MTYEYTKIDLNAVSHRSSDVAFLNEMGAQGWQLMTIGPCFCAYLMREIAPEPRVKRAYTKRAVPTTVPA